MPGQKHKPAGSPAGSGGQFDRTGRAPRAVAVPQTTKAKSPKLGSNQLWALDAMLDTENGWDSNRLQKKWSGSTYNSIMAAVNRHNSSECGGDCPIPDDQVLITSSLGPRGGSRWVATDRKANAEFKAEWAEARRVKEEANRAEYYARQAAQNNVGDVSENPTDEVGKALHDEDGRYHSIDDLPARTLRDGTKEWRSHGILNREHGPAVERGDGTKEWFKHGQRHCVVGPAVVNADGTEEFWIEDEKVDEDVWELYRE